MVAGMGRTSGVFKPVACLIFISFSLLACRASEVEIAVSEANLRAVKSGAVEAVEFEARFSNLGSLDTTKRDEMSRLEALIRDYIAVDDFSIENSETGFEVVIEGSIPLAPSKQDAPWYIHVERGTKPSSFSKLQVKTGRQFENLKARAQAINFLLAPEAFHPTKFVLRGDAASIIAPAVEINGEYHLLWRGQAGRKLKLKFADGIFDHMGAGFFFKF